MNKQVNIEVDKDDQVVVKVHEEANVGESSTVEKEEEITERRQLWRQKTVSVQTRWKMSLLHLV